MGIGLLVVRALARGLLVARILLIARETISR